MLKQIAQSLARNIKRSIFYGGYSKNVHSFLKEIKASRSPWKITLKDKQDRNIYVNLSFDLELGLNGSFWRGDLKRCLAYSELAFANFPEILPLLNASNIQYNVQICGGLLEADFYGLPEQFSEQ